MARTLAAQLLVVGSLLLFTSAVRGQQPSSSSSPADVDWMSAGEYFTKLTATFAVGGAEDGWHNIFQATFAQELLPAFLADNPATTAPWVRANTSELKFTLRLELLGLIPKAAKVNYLAWELSKPLAALFPAPAAMEFQVATTGNTSAEAATTQQVAASFLVTFAERPASALATTVTAATLITELQKAVNASATVLSTNAGMFIRNMTSVSPRLTRRLTNGSFSFVVPSRQTDRRFTLDPLRAQLTRPSYMNGTLTQQPASNQTTGGDTNATSPVASSYNINFGYTSPSPSQESWADKPLSLKVPLKLLALKAEDVSSFFIGMPDAYSVSDNLCRLTDDPCCKSCDPSKSCVRKPMCLPKEPLTLNEILCFADSHTPCMQRWGCSPISDIAGGANLMSDYMRGFWGGEIEDYMNQHSWMWNYSMSMPPVPRCIPWRLSSCMYGSGDATDCTRWGMCQVVEQALCARDKCTSWDEAKKAAVTDPCCSNSGDCSKATLPLAEPATCQWDGSTQTCRQQRVDNCTAAGLDMEAALLCVISNTMKANVAKPLPQVANELCNATVSGACAVPSSVSCTTCLGVKARLTTAMARVSDEADACKRQGDPSPHYSPTGVNKKHSALLRAALQMVLMPATMCGQVSTALLAAGADGKPLLSAANVLAHGGAWICCNSAIAKQLCDKPGGSDGGNNGTSGGTGNTTASGGSNSSTTTADSANTTLDCSQCGRFMAEFANLTAAGKASYTPSSVTAFCLDKVTSESQQGGGGPGGSGQEDVFAEPDQCKMRWEKQHWCPTDMGCEYQQLCVPYSDMNWGSPNSGSSQQPITSACTALNATACSAQDECMFMPQPGLSQTATCLKVINTIRNWGLDYVLSDPYAVCATAPMDSDSRVSIISTCGSACKPTGYCQNDGAGDPQCVVACANCTACVSRVNATAQAIRQQSQLINPNATVVSFYGTPDQDYQQLSLAAFKQCMRADASPTQPGSPQPAGMCMTRQRAVCAAGEQAASCGYAPGCGRQETCARFDPVNCDRTKPKGQGMACQVAKVCNAITTSPSILPASKLCGPGLLQACANPTSPLCLKCVDEAEDLQNRLRSLSKYQCRRPQYYMPIQGQECTHLVNGWLSSKPSCSAVVIPRIYQAFQAAAAKSSTYGTNNYWDADGDKWGGFCSSVQAEAAAPGSTLALPANGTAAAPANSTTTVKPALRHLLQTNSTNTSSPVAFFNSSSEPATNTTGNSTTSFYQPSPTNSIPPPPYCQSCNPLPTWVYDSITPSLFSNGTTTTSNCSAASCSSTQQPAATLLPLLQTRWFDPDLNSTIESKQLPAEAVRIAARKVWSVSSVWLGAAQLPADYGCGSWSSNATNITCRVDAQVAINLLVGHLLETYFSCDVQAAANAPWGSCHTFSVAWLPPNLPCPADNTANCTSRTFAFQLQQFYECTAVNGTGWCRKQDDNTTISLMSPPPRSMYRPETFATGGPLAPAMGLSSCPLNNSQYPECAPPAYLVPVEDDLRLLAALPDDSYSPQPHSPALELVKVQGWDTVQYTRGLPFCPLGILPCPPPQTSADNSTYINPGSMTSPSPGGYPSYSSMTTPNLIDVYSNYPEGIFQAVYDSATGNVTYQYQTTPLGWSIFYTIDHFANMYYQFDPRRDGNSWGYKDNTWMCIYQAAQINRSMGGGYVEPTPAGLAGACVDMACSYGSPDFVKKQWTGEINCNPWEPNSCCTGIGLKPGNKQTCEALSNCQYSASCSVSVDDCYEQFKGSLTDASFGESHAVCDASCSFQPVAQAFGGAVFSALPTLRTAPDGSTSVVDGVCYNKTLWTTCTAKTTAATCKLWSYGNNTCTWQPVCQRVKAADYSCTGSSDSCCLGSQHARFDEYQEDVCTSQTGDGGKPCRVGQACVLIDDRCNSKTTPWDCLADATCQFLPSASSRMGGVCTTQRQVNPCRGLDATECATAAVCMPADRCITDHCPDASDSCCALGDDPTACTYKPGCQVASTCLPAVDECSYHPNATTCGSAKLCRWVELPPPQELSSSMLPPSSYPSGTDASAPSNATLNATAWDAFNSTLNNTCSNGTCGVNFNSSGGYNGSMSGPYGTCVMDTAAHPCASATDDASCTSLRDSVGRPLCYSQPYCASGCSRCLECLNVVKSSWLPSLAALTEAQAPDAVQVSAAFSLWCRQRGVDNSTCDSIASQIVYSPKGNLARRPGMLCSLAGQCSGGCDIPVELANGTASRQPFDKCTDDGTTAGNPVPPPSVVTGACASDADCTGGAWCSWAAAAEPVCSCSDGLDKCQVLGKCNSDRCPLYADLVSLNTDKASCANNTGCPVAFVCQQTAYTTFNCINSELTATSHPGFCVEAAPSLTSAVLADTADIITVSLSAAANSLFTKCETIFSLATMSKIGPDALCVADAAASTMKIRIMNVPSVDWGITKLEVKANQTLLTSSKGSRAFAGTSSEAIALCANCPAPVAKASGPQYITKPCPGSDLSEFRAVVFDASSSYGTAAAPITSIKWELVMGDSSNISATVDRANAASLMDQMLLQLDGATLTNSPAGKYMLLVTATNSLHNSATSAALEFTVAEAGSKPSIRVFAPGTSAGNDNQPAAVEVVRGRGLKLFSTLQIDSVCKGSAAKVNYLWTCVGTAPDTACTVPAAAAAQKQLRLEPQDFTALKQGVDYTFTLTAGFAGSTESTAASAVVRVARSPLVVQLSGPMGAVKFGSTVSFDASKSTDPDNPAASLGYSFSCEPKPCFNDTAYRGVFPKRSAWVLDTTQLKTGTDYTIAVTVAPSSTAGSTDDRKASTSLTFTPEAGDPPTGTITRFCGFDPADYSPLPCPAKHNPSQDLIVTLDLDDGFEEATLTWSAAGGGPALLEGTNAKGTRKPMLLVKPAAFPSGSIKLAAQMALAGATGSASITIPLNTPPSCPNPPCFVTDVNSTTFPAYTFVGSVNGWIDADGDTLSYEFGQVIRGEFVAREAAGPSTSYVFKGFEPGSYQLYACAIDAIGARTCSLVSIRVNQPAAQTAAQISDMVKASVAKIDVQQLASTGDVSAVTAALQEFASIASFAAAPAASSGSSPGSVAAPAPVNAEVVAKQNTLLTTLTSVMNTKDPASMGSSLNAAGAVSKAASGLSGAAGDALLAVVDGFVNANKGSKTADVSDAQVSTATKVLSKGLKAAYTSSTAPARRRALLQSADPGAAQAADAAALQAAAAYKRLASSTGGLLTLIALGTAKGATRVAGADDICLAVARDDLAAFADGRSISLDCSSATTAAAGRRLLAPTVSPSVTLPSGFAAACAADSVCQPTAGAAAVITSQYFADPATFVSTVKDWPASSLVRSDAEPGTTLTAVTGVLPLSMNDKTSGGICSSGSANCTASVLLPLGASFNPALPTLCLKLDALTGDPSASLQASTTTVAVVPGSTSGTSVSCATSSLGNVVAVQYTPRALTPPASTPDNSTANDTSSPPPAAPASPSPSPQLGVSMSAAAYAADTSVLTASDVTAPVAYAFTFSNYNYNAIFKVNGAVDEAATAAFKLAVKKAFLLGVVSKTGMVVGTTSSLQVNRVNITSIRPGSVLVDLEFWPPATASASDLALLTTAVTTKAADFFATPELAAAYGAPQVAGTPLVRYKPFGLDPTTALAVGIGVGVGGALLVGVAIGVVVVKRRRAQTLAPADQP